MKDNMLFKDEVDYREALRNPRKLISLAYFVFIIVLIAVGLFFVKNFTPAYKNTVPQWGGRQDASFKDIEHKKGVAQPGINPAELLKPSPELLAKGKDAFTKTCASCHGEQGKGDGPAGVSLNPKPRDFTSPQGWKNGPSFSAMYATIQEGIPGTGMTAYEYLPPEERFAIIHYIRSLANHFPAVTNNELADLDAKYNLSKGSAGSNQISVKRAMQILVKEHLSAPQKSDSILDYINSHPNDKGSIVFNKIFINKSEALKSLDINKAWLQNFDAFKNIINVMPSAYKNSGVELNAEQWTLLHKYLVKFYLDSNQNKAAIS